MRITTPRVKLHHSSSGFLLLVLAACSAPPSSDVGDVTRLAVLDISAAMQLVNGNKECGFESPAAISTQELSGMPGTDGTVTRRVKDCVIDLATSSSKWPYFTCDKDAGTAQGKIRFSGSRTIKGRIIGKGADPNPLIPSGGDALSVQIDSLGFENFDVVRHDKAGHLAIKQGTVSGRAKIILAASRSDGFCSTPTPNAHLEDLVFQDAAVHFTNLLTSRDYTINSSRLSAINGAVDGQQNYLKGTLVLDGSSIDIPIAGDKPVFDPDYDPASFVSDFACPDANLQLPVTYQCGSIDEIMGNNAARVAGLALTTIVQLLDENEQCGFHSDAVLDSATVVGQPGEQGTVTQRVDQCTLSFPKEAQTTPDCLGKSNGVQGEITVSATRVSKGIIPADLRRSPVVPKDDEGVEFAITDSNIQEFQIHAGDSVLLLHSGSLTGKMQARVARSTNYGVCSAPSKIAALSDVNLSNATIRVGGSSGSLEAVVQESSLSAVNGAWKGKENAVWGTIKTGGNQIEIAESTPTPLDNAYDAETFAQSWQCDPTLAKPVSFDCSTDLPIPETAARLSVATLGALTSLVEHDTTCGFSSPGVLAAGQKTGTLGFDGSTGTFSVQNCQLRFVQPTVIATDCNGKKTTVQGTVTFHATKTMTGYNTGAPDRPILPASRDAIAFDMSVDLQNFKFFIDTADGSTNSLSVNSGTLVGKVSPRLALDKMTGACSKATPITSFQGVGYRAPTDVILDLGGMQFGTHVEQMSLIAQSGAKESVSNHLEGSMVLSGESYTFPIHGSSEFDIDYSPAVFDASYQSCDPNLVVPADDTACNFKTELATQTARGLALAVASLGRTVSADANCGLDLKNAQRDPATSTGRRGGLGSATWTAPPRGNGTCNYNFGANHVQDVDCLGRTRYLGGNLPVSASLIVRGTVEDMRGTTYINPTSPDGPSDYSLTTTFQNLYAADVDPNGGRVQSISIPSGNITAAFNPIMGEDRDRDFTFLVPTPITRFNQIQLNSSGPVTLGVGSMTFVVTINGATVRGFSGSYRGTSNHIEGTVNLDGMQYSVSDVLDPAYDQATFDRRYSCDPNLAAIVPSR